MRSGAKLDACSHPIVPGARFCVECGAARTKACRCGEHAPITANFCPVCGHEFPKAETKP